MRIVEPNAVEMYNPNPQKHIEAIGRVCYKSEDKITSDSHKKFIKDMRQRRHWAMLEHFRFIVRIPYEYYQRIVFLNSPYLVCTNEENGCIVSGSARGLMDLTEYVEYNSGHFGINEDHYIALMAIQKHLVGFYDCPELFGQSDCRQGWIEVITDTKWLSPREKLAHCWHSVLITCDRGVTHELVRHRPVSFAQESTRYCNYSLGKYGKEIAVIKPLFFDEKSEQYILWEKCMKYAEEMYNQLVRSGATAQEARSVLPNSTKADIVLTATNQEWAHIFDLRYIQITGPAHPQMVEIMTKLVDQHEWAQKIVVAEKARLGIDAG